MNEYIQKEVLNDQFFEYIKKLDDAELRKSIHYLIGFADECEEEGLVFLFELLENIRENLMSEDCKR